ncbi:DUF5685 family protein [Nocardia sp. NPDC050406]|uniref:DUF5685 family protein n=1 Tax=Nocardia sp. NPDC050406 TaxID=3364318 RepID=UPI003799B560
MFGLLKPCAHGAAKYGIDASAWQTQMCGLCLGLRDGHGQLARAATNTDAILLGVLTEAQQPRAATRTDAGPCPLRGMRRASVAAADSPGVRLAATASLLLGAAKIRDHIDDGDTGPVSRRPMGRVSNRWHSRARAAADEIGLDIEPLVAAIESQARVEQAVLAAAAGEADGLDSLARLTAPTQLCAADLFAHTAVLAGRPENIDALREVGWHFGRIAHLADAIEDLESDAARGKFNPLTATGTSVGQAEALLRESHGQLRAALVRVGLAKVATVRWMLLDPLHGVVRRIGRATGAARVCATDHATRRRPAAGSAAESSGSTLVKPVSHFEVRGDLGVRPPRTPHRRPSIWEGLGIIGAVYCTGYACCAEHTNPCTGQRQQPWYKHCADCCDCAECCSSCGECCSCDGCCCCCDC